jgi:hypothetical protein
MINPYPFFTIGLIFRFCYLVHLQRSIPQTGSAKLFPYYSMHNFEFDNITATTTAPPPTKSNRCGGGPPLDSQR